MICIEILKKKDEISNVIQIIILWTWSMLNLNLFYIIINVRGALNSKLSYIIEI